MIKEADKFKNSAVMEGMTSIRAVLTVQETPELLNDRKANGIFFSTMQKFDDYDESLTEDRTNTNVAGAYDDAYQSEENYDDPLYNEIVDFAVKTGKISVNGNYQIAIGEPIIQLEGMFGLKPKGLLHSGEFFIEYWRKIGADKVAAFRSPMSCKQNAKVMNICNRDEVIKWYGNLKNIIVFNAWDTTMSAMNGED